MAKITHPKTKAQLDAMTKEGIGKHRMNYLSQHNGSEKVVGRYMDELQLYMDIRFKEDIFARYKRWEKQSVDKTVSKDDRDSMKLIVKMIKKMGGPKEYYRLT